MALLLGAVAIATAPASTLMVIRECDSSGPLTENLLGIIAVNNLFCITAYAGAAALSRPHLGNRRAVALRCVVPGGFPAGLAARRIRGVGLPGGDAAWPAGPRR